MGTKPLSDAKISAVTPSFKTKMRWWRFQKCGELGIGKERGELASQVLYSAP